MSLGLTTGAVGGALSCYLLLEYQRKKLKEQLGGMYDPKTDIIMPISQAIGLGLAGGLVLTASIIANCCFNSKTINDNDKRSIGETNSQPSRQNPSLA